MNSLKIVALIITGFTLSACSAYQEHFKCKAQPGLGCSSITEVNNLVNQGWPATDVLKKSAKKESFLSRLFKCKSCHNTAAQNLNDVRTHFFKHHPNTLRIWIAPHTSQNQYWDEQFVYSAIQRNAFDVDTSNIEEAHL